MIRKKKSKNHKELVPVAVKTANIPSLVEGEKHCIDRGCEIIPEYIRIV